MTDNYAFEEYSDHLVYAAEMAHRLFVNYTLMERAIHSILRDMNWEIDKDHPDYMEYGFEKAQLDRFKQTYQFAMYTFFDLLMNESKFPLRVDIDINYEEPRLSIHGYPDWIKDLFPYYQNKEKKDRVQQSEHYQLINPDYNDNLAEKYKYDADILIPKSVPVNFIKVWWPLAGGFAENGYIVTDRIKDGLLMRYGREF